MGVPSLGYLCRRTAIANISQLTYVPEDLPIDKIMDILRCVPSAGLLKVIQANAPHILQSDQVEVLWERFCRKEFNYLLKHKITAHKEEYGENSYFPVVPWEELYEQLAQEEFLRLREDTATLAARTMQLNHEKSKKQTTLLADPRALIKARVKGAPGARGPHGPQARGPRNAVQKAADETRQLAIQRKQAMAVARKPPTKIDVAPKGLQDELRRSAQVIKAPVKKLGHKRALEDLRNKTQPLAKKRSASPPVAQPNGKDKSGEAPKSTASLTSATTAKSALPITPKEPAPVRTRGLFSNLKPLSMKGMPPVKTKQVTGHSNGTVTITVSIDWTLPQNQQILESYTTAEKAAALSEPATVSTIPAAEYRKRGFNAISSDKGSSPSASTNTSASTSATSPFADEDIHHSLAPSKRRKTAPSLFMPHKAVAKPRTQD